MDLPRGRETVGEPERADSMNDVETRLAALENHLAGLLENNHRLQADNESLRADNDDLRGRLTLLETGTHVTGPVDVEPVEPAFAGEPTEERPVSRRGMIAAAAGAAGGMILARATPAAAANGNPVILGSSGNTATLTTKVTTTSGYGIWGETSDFSTGVYGRATAATGSTIGIGGLSESTGGYGVFGNASATTGTTFGVSGSSSSSSGTGVRGNAPSGTGSTFGVRGTVSSTNGTGVYGYAGAASGTTYGVRGEVVSANGFALFGTGRMKVTGRSYQGTPNSAPNDADLNNGMISFYLDQANNALKVRVKYSTGTLKTATINLV